MAKILIPLHPAGSTLLSCRFSHVSQGSAPVGLGANKRTAKYVGGGAAIGAVLGGLLGGVKGAAIGAVVGGAGGAGTQVYRGRKKNLPAETELSFKLAEDLEMRPVAAHSSAGLKRRQSNLIQRSVGGVRWRFVALLI